jgi:hypothetical protein
MSDEFEYFAPRDNLEEIVKKGHYRESLIALRNYVAHELEGNRCKQCSMSQLRTGDTAALVLRLQKIIEDIEAIPDPNEEVDDLERLRKRKASGAPAAPDLPPPSSGGFHPRP